MQGSRDEYAETGGTPAGDSRPPVDCPRCGESAGRRIRYGLPGPGRLEDDVPLGGCVIGPASPRWRCTACGHSWGRVSTR